MQKAIKTLYLLAVAVLALAQLAYGQGGQNIITTFGGVSNASDFAYGLNGVTAGPLSIYAPGGGTVGPGAGSIIFNTPCVALSSGKNLCPIVNGGTAIVGNAANAETVTWTSASAACSVPTVQVGTCSAGATFSNSHGANEFITTATYGLQEAINVSHGAGTVVGSGGQVAIGAGWATLGGTLATVTAATGYSNVSIINNGGIPGGAPYYGLQPSTLTSMAVPTTLAAGTVVFAAAPVGTWANSAYYFCVTYVDALGGEGPCSLTYNQTPTVNYSVTITSPAASTGAVGWRFYAGASYNAAYLMPIDATHCTLTTLESIVAACAIGSNGGWIAPPLTTTSLRPNATVTTGALASPTVNISATQPQAHTTFAYQPSVSIPLPIQAHYGPFPAYGSTTSGQVDTLGSINLPAGFLNAIGRTVRLKGKITGGSVNTAALPTLTVVLSWAGGTTAGVGLTTCSFEGVAVGATKTYTGPFECTLDTNAVGATAVGTVMPSGYLSLQPSDVSAVAQVYSDSNVAAVGSLGLFAQDTVNIVYTSNTNTSGGPQLLGLDVEVLQ